MIVDVCMQIRGEGASRKVLPKYGSPGGKLHTQTIIQTRLIVT